jgi:hypothetical protein
MRDIAERRCLAGSSRRTHKRVSDAAFDAPVDFVKECLLVVAEDHFCLISSNTLSACDILVPAFLESDPAPD